MKRFIPIVLVVAALSAVGLQAAEGGVKQPFFLMCPHKERLSAWSLFFVVDKSDPSKVVSLGLEELSKQNSADSSYEAVLAAQKDPKTASKELGTLAAKDFASGKIEVTKDDALKVSLTPMGENQYRLMVSVRISADGRFTIGGKDQSKRDVIVTFDKGSKTWKSEVKSLKDSEGNAVDGAAGKQMTGIAFPVTGTGIYTVVGAIDGMDPVKLLER